MADSRTTRNYTEDWHNFMTFYQVCSTYCGIQIPLSICVYEHILCLHEIMYLDVYLLICL